MFEQPVVIIDEDENEWHLRRRVVVQLHQPTQDGDTEVAVLTNLPDTDADATVVSQLYLGRWTIEGLFQVVTDQFAFEIKTLGYPQAALFSFCMALVAYHLLALVRTALGSVHGHGKVEAGISNYYLVEEIQATYRGMMIALHSIDWQVIRSLSPEEFCSHLQYWASHVNLKRFASSPRGKKNRTPDRPREPHRPHVSTARLLAQNQNKFSP